MEAEAEPFFLRTTERKVYKNCRQQWYWGYIEKLRGGGIAPALTFGTLIHAALEAWYIPGKKRGIHPVETFQKLYKESDNLFTQYDADTEEKVSALDMGIAMLNGYVGLYGKEPHIEIIKPEYTFQIPIKRNGKLVANYVGTIDAVGRDLRNDSVFMFEHKTAKSIGAYTPINSVYGEQGLSYWWAATQVLRDQKVLKDNQSIDKIIYNYLRKAMPDTRPTNAQGLRVNKPTQKMVLTLGVEQAILQAEVSKRQPLPLFGRHTMDMSVDNIRMVDARIQREVYEMGLVREGKLPVIKNPGDHCNWCPYREMCELKEMGQEWRYYREAMYNQYDPYEDHRDRKD